MAACGNGVGGSDGESDSVAMDVADKLRMKLCAAVACPVLPVAATFVGCNASAEDRLGPA